ncbi:MAG: HIT family protein [Patescibacteria group bacterium]
MDCLFCKIINKEIPNYSVYEDSRSLAFLDIHPKCKGHTVVIPKVHAETLLDLDEQLFHGFLMAVKKTQERIEEVLHPDGYNVGWNQGEAGGQVVPHLHIHILPRWKGDGGSSMHGIVSSAGETNAAEIGKLFV